MSPLQYIGRRLARFLAKPRERNSHIPTSPWGLLAATLRKGDVVLVEGSSRFASAIKYLTQSTWSHAALYVGDTLGPAPDGGEPAVLVDVDVVDGVRTIPLSAFATYRRAYDALVACAAGDAPAGTCIDGWLRDAAPLLADEDARTQARGLLEYYLARRLRGPDAGKYCPAG